MTENHQFPDDEKNEQWKRRAHDLARLYKKEKQKRKQCESDLDSLRKKTIQDREARKLESLGIMAAGIAHDLNNILYPILGYAEMALDEVPESGPAREFLIEILESTRRGREMVGRLLAFGRRSEGKKRQVNVPETIREALKLMASIFPRTVALKSDISDIKGVVIADPAHIHQIIMELCANAYQAMADQGGGTLNVTSEAVVLTEAGSPDAELKPGPYLRITVADTGPGIGPDCLEQLFDPCGRGAGPDDRGMYIGLAAVYDIVQVLEGGFRVASVPGAGTCFILHLPLSDAEPPCEEIESEETLPGCSERILVVDDEEPIVRMLTHMLRRMGYQVVGETDGAAALKCFKARPDAFDLALLDQTMPGMTGDRLAEEIHGIRPNLPIMVFSGRQETISTEQAHKAGVREHLIKPLNRTMLASRIRQILDQTQKTILVVDDEPAARKMLRFTLARAGYTVIEAKNGAEGLHQYRVHEPDLVITDMLMGNKGGVDMIYAMVSEFPYVRIIAVTGGGAYGTEPLLETARDLGAIQTFAKPLSQGKLLDAVREALAEKKK